MACSSPNKRVAAIVMALFLLHYVVCNSQSAQDTKLGGCLFSKSLEKEECLPRLDYAGAAFFTHKGRASMQIPIAASPRLDYAGAAFCYTKDARLCRYPLLQHVRNKNAFGFIPSTTKGTEVGWGAKNFQGGGGVTISTG
ncbi:hypothetical protein CEXT_677721 [Caerostris extrusa]|uniref:Uncharacterized protein n=1 Tax=Caerostris extrusa TaxID=172846 RepID=A0AAV4N524_CAEEX|nr:hypothetical protein CEXT_677721 [Caerostris extrusa]